MTTFPHRSWVSGGIALAVSAFIGCSASETDDVAAPPESSGFPLDSAGVLISVTDSSEAFSSVGWVIDSVPDLVLGDSPDPEHQFYGVRGLRGLPNGGVLVVDGVSRELRFFDANGDLQRKAGGKGEGPGEFSSPALVQTVGTDSLLFWDHDLKRFQILSPDGEDSRTIRLVKRWPAGGNAPLGAVGDRMLVRKPETATLAMYQVAGAITRSVDFIWVIPGTGDEVLIERFLETPEYSASSRRYSGSILIPFAPRPTGTVTSETALIFDGAGPEIREYDTDVTLKRIFRVLGSARPVTTEMVDDWWESRVSAGLTNWLYVETHTEGMPIPEVLPAFQSLLVDEEGWVWAQIYQVSLNEPQEWMVFDPEGRAHGLVQTPAGLKISRIGEDFILGVTVDDLGVERVYRYELHRIDGGRFDS